MKISLICICGLLCLFPDDIKGLPCQCTNWNGVGVCTSCSVGCYLTSGGGCDKCLPNCVRCQQSQYCDVCEPGVYGPICDRDCNTCRNGSCNNNTCTDGCADGYFYYESVCSPCLEKCVTCYNYTDCTSCIAGRTGPYCQNCIYGHYHHNWQCIQCNTNCLHGKCNEYSGECTNGCKDGWTGWKCQDACAQTCYSCERYRKAICNSCPLNRYGTLCENDCSSYCVPKDGRQCQQDDGTCLAGCINGYTGDQCDVHCDADCSSNCDRHTGVCDGNKDNGVIIGGAVGSATMVVLIIVAVLVFIFIKRRRGNEADPERNVTYENSPINNDPCNHSVTGNDCATRNTDNYTALQPPLLQVYEELDNNDDVDYGDIQDYEVPTTSNYKNI